MSDEGKQDAKPAAQPATGEEKAAARAAAGEQTAMEKAAAEEAGRSIAERAEALLAHVRHAHAHNAPRSTSELTELEHLLGHLIGADAADAAKPPAA